MQKINSVREESLLGELESVRVCLWACTQTDINRKAVREDKIKIIGGKKNTKNKRGWKSIVFVTSETLK